MNQWSLKKTGYDPADAAPDGNRFLCANGYLGLRGAPEEAGSALFPAITLAGVYDRNGDRWREPVNAPNALFVRLSWNGRSLALGGEKTDRHSVEIDYRCGIRRRDTDFGPVRLFGERFAAMDECHLLADRLRLRIAEDGDLEILAGISADIWDINGPHLFGFRFEAGDTLRCTAETGEKKTAVAAAQCIRTDFDAAERIERRKDGLFRVLRRAARKGEELTLDVFAAVYTSLDTSDPAEAAAALCRKAADRGFDACAEAHADAWERIWARSEIVLEGDEEAARALHASQYHLNAVAPRHAGSLSIPARGLSGQTYKGAIFWDSEMFFFPMFVHTQPEIARSLLRYRIETLPGARKKAEEYGCRGAFYPWESQEGGEEGCTDFNVVDVFTHRPVRTYFRDKQIHISGDIAYALRSYYEITGDRSLLEAGGAEVILECARFYLSRACRPLDREEAEYPDVIGPDEYHERVANSAFTNRMIRHCFESALMLENVFRDRRPWLDGLLRRLDFRRDWDLLAKVCAQVRGPRVRNGVIEQFDGYFGLEDCSLESVRSRLRDPREYWGGDHGVAGPTQIIKQADVIAMMALFPESFSDAEVAANWAYYEPRTEHGSSLSACMYALTACRIGRLEDAWALFRRTASIDVTGGGKEWAGEIYIGGTHPAANGGAWMIAALGFAGLRVRNGVPELRPRLPRQIRRLAFPFTAGGKRLMAEVTHGGAEIRPL